MIKRIFYLMTVSLLLVIGCVGEEPEKKPLPREQAPAAHKTMLDAAAADPYEDGCVSCHKKTAQVDQSLPAYVSRISGHPEVKEATVNECYRCHEAEKDYSLYKKFYRGIHKVHWESESFYSEQEGRCYACHTVETNGVSGIKKYPLAGYRSGIEATGEEDTNKKAVPETKTKQPQVKQDQKAAPERQPQPEPERQPEQKPERQPEQPAPQPEQESELPTPGP